MDIFNGFFKGKQVLVTGHTGFKGSWLSIWLTQLGANVIGLSLDPASNKDLFIQAGLDKRIKEDLRIDIRDRSKVTKTFNKYQPDIVFHLAAQPLVRLSYEQPVETYEVNVMGTINVMEAIRTTPSVRVAVMITTDKCYENNDSGVRFVESDPMGGYDPYSSSKGACEIAIQSWRRSFFNPDYYGIKHNVAIASVRAGNVIGGGDWAKDRIIPDCIRAIEENKEIQIRSPKAVRPWEHVLEPLSGYLLLAKEMWNHPKDFCEGWNFGPEEDSIASVWEISSRLVNIYGKGRLKDCSDPNDVHEAEVLLLCIDKAKKRLGWHPRLKLEECIALVAEWYKNYADSDVYDLCVNQIIEFTNKG